MGKSKTKKGSKFARMSDEERARYLQYRAAIEEEARRRKEQLIETFMKNKLKREQAFSRLNAAKINQQWRHTLRILKCIELKQDLEALYQWFDYAADKKAKLIESLLDDLDEAENQYGRLHQGHLEMIDRFIYLYEKRVYNFHKLFLYDRNIILTKTNKIINLKTKNGINEKEHLQSILICMEQTANKKNKCQSIAHMESVDELSTEAIIRLENYVNAREFKIEEIWKTFYRILEQNRDQTEDRRREYLNLRAADFENCQQIFQNHQKINSLIDILHSLKTQQLISYTNDDGRLLELKIENKECTELFNLLRKRLIVEKEMGRKKLNVMNQKADDVTKVLQVICDKGRDIIKLMQLCNKIEIRHDKRNAESITKSELTEEEEKDILQNINSFQDPFAKSLIEEQKQLKASLKKYLTQYSTARKLPKTPLTIYRPSVSAPIPRRSIAVSGEKIANSGSISYCTHELMDADHHVITIELH